MNYQIMLTCSKRGELSTVRLPDGTYETRWFPAHGNFSTVLDRSQVEKEARKTHIELAEEYVDPPGASILYLATFGGGFYDGLSMECSEGMPIARMIVNSAGMNTIRCKTQFLTTTIPNAVCLKEEIEASAEGVEVLVGHPGTPGFMFVRVRKVLSIPR